MMLYSVATDYLHFNAVYRWTAHIQRIHCLLKRNHVDRQLRQDPIQNRSIDAHVGRRLDGIVQDHISKQFKSAKPHQAQLKMSLTLCSPDRTACKRY